MTAVSMVKPLKKSIARSSRWASTITVMAGALVLAAIGLRAEPGAVSEGADTALIVSVDVSQSVDAERYQLQIEGIALALEDPSVVAAITSGPKGAILFALVTWADQANVSLDWHLIRSREDAAVVAKLVRSLPQKGGEFTCIARMLHSVSERIIPSISMPVERIVVDVSGDGIDNCSDINAVHTERDAVLAKGATINGLPILVAGENDIVGSGAYRAPGFGLRELSVAPDHDVTTLDQWFQDHVVGGPETFLLVAHGYADFARALRQKFVTEISFLKAPSGGASDVRESALVHR